MNREIIDVPLPYTRITDCTWRPDWRGQPGATGTDGSEQVVYNRFPRFVGSFGMVLVPDLIGPWRALIARGRGRVNAYRFRMIDPVLFPLQHGDSHSELRAFRDGLYVEPRPQVPCPAGAAAGASSITVDERSAPRPIRVGQILSHGDWPFMVEARSGSGPSTTLQVAMLRKPIPAGDQIDLVARGVFLAGDDAMGWPDYGLDRVARPQLNLQEWISR